MKICGSPVGFGAERRYSPADFVRADKNPVVGHPRFEHISTSHVKRQNLTMRMSMRRFTRLTNDFSKKMENHIHSLAIYFVIYNFVRIHKTLKTTPAMEAGITDRLWSFDDIAAMVAAKEVSAKRGPYKPRQIAISN